MMKRALGLCFLLLAAGGCTPQLENIESTLARNTEAIENARIEQKLVAREVGDLSALLRLEDDSGLENNARLQARLTRVENKLDQVTRKLDDNFEFMRGISARVDLLATRMGVPTLGEFKTVEGGQTDASTLQDLPEEGRAMYNAAMLDRSRGDTDAAIEGLKQFLGRYQNSELADDASYWLGAMAMSRGDTTTAMEYFMDLLDNWPQAERRADAMLKLLVAEKARGNLPAAGDWLQRLQAEYPGSEVTALAEAELSATE
jgi:tol-pal system protein YbgF